MITCLADVLRPSVGVATVRLLRRLGVTVYFPELQTCCGQPFFNSGYADQARPLAQHAIETFNDGRPVVVPSGSCAAMVRVEYPHLFHENDAWHKRAKELASRTYELAEFLVHRLGVQDVGAHFEGTVTYHPACHLRALGLHDETERLMRNVRGAHYVPLEQRDQCCGFGGSFAVRYPEISGAMVEAKAACIAGSGACAVVSSDTGCLLNIGGCLHRRNSNVQTLHLAELLADDRAASARSEPPGDRAETRAAAASPTLSPKP